MLIHLNPVLKPSTYLIEISSLMNAVKSPFFNVVIDPALNSDKFKLSNEALSFAETLPATLKNFFSNPEIFRLFNLAQRRAIIHACNFKAPFTLINGPPGTGKTFTSLGMMSAVLEHMKVTQNRGIILACAHSNTVINDWVRKIALATQPKEGVPVNTIINSKGQP
jgi:Cdc6-like AAA superfamily ATPase